MIFDYAKVDAAAKEAAEELQLYLEIDDVAVIEFGRMLVSKLSEGHILVPQPPKGGADE